MFTGKSQLENVEKLVKELAKEITSLQQVGIPAINSDKRRLVHLAGKLNPGMNTRELLEAASNSTDPLTILACEGQKLVNELGRYSCKLRKLLETGNLTVDPAKVRGKRASKFTVHGRPTKNTGIW